MDNMSHISIGNVLPNRICHGILSLLAYIELHNFFNCCMVFHRIYVLFIKSFPYWYTFRLVSVLHYYKY